MRSFLSRPSVLVLVILLSHFVLLASAGVGEYTEDEKKALKKFREAATSKDLLYRDYMSTDDYLLPWLKGTQRFPKARKMDVNGALEMLAESVRWRKENGIDNIAEEDLDCLTLYPAQTDVIDKKGRPVMQVNLGQWDIRKIVLAGKYEQFVRCTMKHVELMSIKIRELNENDKENHVTQFVFITDLKGYNLRQHGCIACIPAILYSIQGYEANYPQIIGASYFINTPVIFEALLNAVKTTMAPATRDALKVYGFEKNAWQAGLAEIISLDQLTPQYGGTKGAPTK